MSIGAILYRILIGPLELFFEVVFVIANRYVDNPAYAIVFLSLAMNFLVLPLYRRADAVQAEERDRENALAPWVNHIKKTFKGDERFMMLQAFYRENNYKPTDSLKGSVSLLLEIPFFIAAYHFLSNLQILQGVQFGPITDLGAPDALLTIGSVTLNVLPILMTLINVVSAAIYMKGFPLKSKIQMYGIAAIFLVFLYRSPAGLVFYWTLNNLFSLVKNIFYKLNNARKVLNILFSVSGAIFIALVLYLQPFTSRRATILSIALLLCMQLPMIMYGKKLSIKKLEANDVKMVFYSSVVYLTILTGVLIPSSVLADSTEEFISIVNYYSPFWYIVSAASIAVGTFIVWFSIFYHLANQEGRQIFSIIVLIAAIASTVNYMMFGKEYGNFSSTLIFDISPIPNTKSMLINVVALFALCVVAIVVFSKFNSIVRAFSIAMCLAVLIMSGINMMAIQSTIAESKPAIKAAGESEPEINISKTGKNVIVIMMDRQIGHYIPFIMHEKPELKEKFAGFIDYENAFSYGTFTNVGSPGLFGGYEYIPEEMNRRSDMKLVEKHNEALKVMPKVFLDAGFRVTVFDPPYANYGWLPDLSIYDEMPDINRGITNWRYSLPELSYEAENKAAISLRNRNLFAYSIFKTSPLLLQPALYSGGTYNAAMIESIAQQAVFDMEHSKGMNRNFLNAYAVLCKLPSITSISDDNSNTFLMMSNDLTHEPMLLQEPAFVPSETVDNSSVGTHYTNREDDEGNILRIENPYQLGHYQANVAAMIKLGEWLDYLRAKGVYDNTRIIIVSDHGRDMRDNISPHFFFTDDNNNESEFDSSLFDCVLLVKDFNSRQYSISKKLISNADTPYIAMDNLVNNPQNPYTGNDIETFDEQSTEPELIYTFDYQTDKNNGNVFLPSNWFTLRDNFYAEENWKYIGYH